MDLMNIFNKNISNLKNYDDIFEKEITLSNSDILLYNELFHINSLLIKMKNCIYNYNKDDFNEIEDLLNYNLNNIKNISINSLDLSHKTLIINSLFLKLQKVKIKCINNKQNDYKNNFKNLLKSKIYINFQDIKKDFSNPIKSSITIKNTPNKIVEFQQQELILEEYFEEEKKNEISENINTIFKTIKNFNNIWATQNDSVDQILQNSKDSLKVSYKANKELKIADKYNKEYGFYWTWYFFILGIIWIIVDFIY